MPIVDKVTKRRLSWYGHIKRRKPEDMTRTVLDMEIPGKDQRQAPHQMDGQYQERHETTWPR